MKLPKYIDQRRNGYFYQRFYPKSVAKIAPAKKFTISLGVKVGASEREIQKAAIVAGDAFDLEVAKLSNSTPEAISDAAIDLLATKELAKMKRRDRDLDPTLIDGVVHDSFSAVISADKPAGKAHLAGQNIDLTPEMIKQAIKLEANRTLDEMMDGLPDRTEVDTQVKQRIRERLSQRSSGGPKTLGSLWAPYLAYRGVEADMESYRFRKKQRDWDAAMSYIGEHPLNDAAGIEINRGLRERVEDQLARGVKPSSAIRSIAMASACFKWAVDTYDLNWRIKTIRTPRQEPELRKVATKEQMITMAKAAIEWNDAQAAILVLGCHGIIPSEIARLEVTKGLASPIPYVMLPPGKTSFRKRVVPVMWAYDVLLDNIDAAIKYCKESKDPSATINKRLRKLFSDDEQISLYGCRHGVRNLYAMANPAIPVPLIASTLGWSGGEQGMILQYGADGVDSSAYIEALHDAGKRAHGPIIEALENATSTSH